MIQFICLRNCYDNCQSSSVKRMQNMVCSFSVSKLFCTDNKVKRTNIICIIMAHTQDRRSEGSFDFIATEKMFVARWFSNDWCNDAREHSRNTRFKLSIEPNDERKWEATIQKFVAKHMNLYFSNWWLSKKHFIAAVLRCCACDYSLLLLSLQLKYSKKHFVFSVIQTETLLLIAVFIYVFTS